MTQRKKMQAMIEAIPATWLDPLLTGDNAVLGKPPWNGPDIERLLKALCARLREIADA